MIFTSNTMNLNIKDAVAYLTFKKLEEFPYIRHAFSTRMGGVSSGEFTSMNMSFNRGDNHENVTENYKRLCSAVGVGFDSLVASAQDHHTNVRRVSSAQKGIGIYKPRDMESVDALITNETGVTLVTYFADCTPILLVDTKNKAIAAAHSGWRGTVAEIGRITVERMAEEFGTSPSDILAMIGPTIGKCCYEVDKTVAEQFVALDVFDSRKFVTDKDNGKYMIDLAEANRQILVKAGVNNDSIVKSDVCTYCNSDLVWSHRATGGKRGGMCALLEIV
ncbi:MAG: peptidoglycan editing factor PgeF [Lachnospiraceae bacterium]|nr:peptidoglycan editing factor PgeF [Lachnospiraceae bacterium]